MNSEKINKYLRLTIANKILAGYLLLSLLLIIISLYAFTALKKLQNLNESIINEDIKVIESSRKIIDDITSQDIYAKKYLILKSRDMLIIFNNRVKEINNLMNDIPHGEEKLAQRFNDLRSLYAEYVDLYRKRFLYRDSSSPLVQKHERLIRDRYERILNLLDNIISDARDIQNRKILSGLSMSNSAIRFIGGLCIAGIVIGIFTSFLITRNIFSSINKLKLATKEISKGNFDYEANPHQNDELGELSLAFAEMARRLKKLEEMYLDTSPLTRLPGGIAIENVLKKRLDEGKSIAFCLIDLDNFKAFNDRYGYAKGSEVIKALAKIIEDAVKEKGRYEDFIGHVGGDDFVLITVPERFRELANYIIEKFDRKIPDFYDPEDRKRGFIKGKNRQGVEMKFPIMTVSIAVVTTKEGKRLNHIKIGEIAAELKEYAKSIPGSLYVVDKRRKSYERDTENVIEFRKKDDRDVNA